MVRGYVIWFGVVDYNGPATCTGSQSPLVKNRSEPQDLVRRLPVCVGTVNTGGSMGIRHASVWWHVGLRGVGSWQYNIVRKLRHASLCRICAVTPHPIHSFPGYLTIDIAIFMNSTTTTATATANTTTSPVTAGSSSMPDLRRAYPVMISRMLSTTPRLGSRGHGRARDESPQPSTSGACEGHGAGVLSSAAKRRRFVGSSAQRLAAPLPRAAATSFAKAPNHEAFRDVDLCFKANVMRLHVWNNCIVLEMASSPSSKGMMLERAECDILTQQKDTIDHHATKTTTGTSEGDCVWVWVALKDRGNAVAYVTVKTWHRQWRQSCHRDCFDTKTYRDQNTSVQRRTEGFRNHWSCRCLMTPPMVTKLSSWLFWPKNIQGSKYVRTTSDWGLS